MDAVFTQAALHKISIKFKLYVQHLQYITKSGEKRGPDLRGHLFL
jgi:hypothetical protein